MDRQQEKKGLEFLAANQEFAYMIMAAEITCRWLPAYTSQVQQRKDRV